MSPLHLDRLRIVIDDMQRHRYGEAGLTHLAEDGSAQDSSETTPVAPFSQRIASFSIPGTRPVYLLRENFKKAQALYDRRSKELEKSLEVAEGRAAKSMADAKSNRTTNLNICELTAALDDCKRAGYQKAAAVFFARHCLDEAIREVETKARDSNRLSQDTLAMMPLESGIQFDHMSCLISLAEASYLARSMNYSSDEVSKLTEPVDAIVSKIRSCVSEMRGKANSASDHAEATVYPNLDGLLSLITTHLSSIEEVIARRQAGTHSRSLEVVANARKIDGLLDSAVVALRDAKKVYQDSFEQVGRRLLAGLGLQFEQQESVFLSKKLLPEKARAEVLKMKQELECWRNVENERDAEQAALSGFFFDRRWRPKMVTVSLGKLLEAISFAECHHMSSFEDLSLLANYARVEVEVMERQIKKALCFVPAMVPALQQEKDAVENWQTLARSYLTSSESLVVELPTRFAGSPLCEKLTSVASSSSPILSDKVKGLYLPHMPTLASLVQEADRLRFSSPTLVDALSTMRDWEDCAREWLQGGLEEPEAVVRDLVAVGAMEEGVYDGLSATLLACHVALTLVRRGLEVIDRFVDRATADQMILRDYLQMVSQENARIRATTQKGTEGEGNVVVATAGEQLVFLPVPFMEVDPVFDRAVVNCDAVISGLRAAVSQDQPGALRPLSATSTKTRGSLNVAAVAKPSALPFHLPALLGLASEVGRDRTSSNGPHDLPRKIGEETTHFNSRERPSTDSSPTGGTPISSECPIVNLSLVMDGVCLCRAVGLFNREVEEVTSVLTEVTTIYEQYLTEKMGPPDDDFRSSQLTGKSLALSLITAVLNPGCYFIFILILGFVCLFLYFIFSVDMCVIVLSCNNYFIFLFFDDFTIAISLSQRLAKVVNLHTSKLEKAQVRLLVSPALVIIYNTGYPEKVYVVCARFSLCCFLESSSTPSRERECRKEGR